MPANKLDGAQALVKCLEREGIEYMFGLSGGAAIPIFDALVTTGTKIKFVLVRHEQGAAHMADGYARDGEACVRFCETSGPGATNTLTGIMTAHMDSVPMIVISGQQVSWMLGKDAFQEADIFGITMPVVKHSYLVKNSNDIPRVVREAYHIATTGRPGPVLIDMPKNVSAGACTVDLFQEMDIPGYKPYPENMDKEKILEIAEALNKSRRPLILAVMDDHLDACQAVKELAEKLNGAGGHLAGQGWFPETHCFRWHGGYAPTAMRPRPWLSDLVLSIGSRLTTDHRPAGQVLAPRPKIHIDGPGGDGR